MKLPFLTPGRLASCLLLLGSACAPAAPSAAGLLGEGPQVKVSGGGDSILVIDWSDAQRLELERAMQTGVVAFAKEGTSLRLLDGCLIEGSYEYHRVSRQEQISKYESSDDIKANLPKTGVSIADKLQAERSSGDSLDVALVTVAVKSSTARELSRSKLTGGACAGATHFLRHAYVGAFAYSAGERSQTKTTVDLFRVVPVGPDKKKESGVANRAGDIEACRATPADGPPPAPIPSCDAVVRITLSRLAD